LVADAKVGLVALTEALRGHRATEVDS